MRQRRDIGRWDPEIIKQCATQLGFFPAGVLLYLNVWAHEAYGEIKQATLRSRFGAGPDRVLAAIWALVDHGFLLCRGDSETLCYQILEPSSGKPWEPIPEHWRWMNRSVLDRVKTIKISGLLVYGVLCSWAKNETQSCYGPQQTIADLVHLSRESVCSRMAVLRKLGLVRTFKQTKPGSTHNSNERFLLPRVDELGEIDRKLSPCRLAIAQYCRTYRHLHMTLDHTRRRPPIIEARHMGNIRRAVDAVAGHFNLPANHPKVTGYLDELLVAAFAEGWGVDQPDAVALDLNRALRAADARSAKDREIRRRLEEWAQSDAPVRPPSRKPLGYHYPSP